MSNTTWKVSDVEEKLKAGKIRGYVIHERRKESLKEPNGKIVSRHYTQRSKEKDFIAWCLWDFAQRHGVILYQEYRFCQNRQWKADFAIPAMKILFEYEGLFSEKSRHTTAKGFTGDTEKYNQAAADGWQVLRFTALNFKTLPQALKKYEK